MSDKKTLLDLADIVRGGDHSVREATVPGFTKDGEPGTICYHPISAAKMMQFQREAQEDKESGDQMRPIQHMIDMLAQLLCNADGSPFATAEQLAQVPTDVLVSLLQAATGSVPSIEVAAAPNASSETVGSDLPTASLPS